MKTGLVLLCVALGAAGAGFVVYRHVASLTAGPVTANAPARAAGPTAPESTPRRVVPDTVPDVALPDLAGQRHSLRDYRGRPTIFNFWATWCAPCRREIPLLNTLLREHAAQRLQIVGIAVDFRDAVSRYTTSTRINYPLLVGEDDGLAAAQAFGMELALPFTIFVDSQQRIVAAKLGELHRDDADVIINAVLAVDAGKLSLAAAKEHISTQLRDLAQARATK
jgi:peroxiredoxin